MGKVPPSRGLTHMRSMCVGVAETGVEHCSPAKKHEETFPFSRFLVTKSSKSHLRGLSSLLKNTLRVHELVARVMRGKCVRQRLMVQVVSFALSTISYYHACEHITRGSRADSCTHCLHARWIMGGAGVDLIPALTEVTISLLQWEKGDRDSGGLGVTCVLCKANFISLCLHPVPHQNFNREVRHSPTWHSSESESALERFEPVTMVKL